MIIVAACGWMAGNPTRAGAEAFFDLYGGVSLREESNASAQKFFPFTSPQPSPVSLTKRFDFGTSGTFGLRGGYWIERFPWLGGAVDLSFFQRRAEGADIDLVPLSLLLMLRYPLLTSEALSKGKLQPYIGIGPSFFYSHGSMDFSSPLGHVTHGNFFTDVGLDLRAGTSWKFSPNVALFVEYRFTHVNLDYTKEDCTPKFIFCSDDAATVVEHAIKIKLETHHLLMGIRF